jgi:hypothetical protein
MRCTVLGSTPNRATILRRNYLPPLNKPFAISAIPEVFLPHIFGVRRRMRVHPVRWTAPKSGKGMRRRTDMTGKITTILAAAIVLASAGVASAQTNRHAGSQWQAPYYNQDTTNLRFGHATDPAFDSFGGIFGGTL